jgi:HEAT repeat protein
MHRRSARTWLAATLTAAALALLAPLPVALAKDATTRSLVGTIESRREEPRRRIAAIDALARHDPASAAPVLVDALNDPDGSIRAAAARAFWTMATRDAAGSREAAATGRGALRVALDDPSVEVAMLAAQALEMLGEPREALAPIRRAALGAPGPFVYARFLAARGLIGLEPPSRLLSFFIDWLREAHEAYARDAVPLATVESAGEALERLARERDPALGPALLAAFSPAHPATSELMRAAARVAPEPAGLTDALVAMLASMHDRVRATAIELLAKRISAADVARWRGPVAGVLDRTPRPEDYVLRAALHALGAAAKVDPAALPVLARWATGSEPAEFRGIAVDALAAASNALDESLPAPARDAAKPVALDAFASILSRSTDDSTFRSAARAVRMTERDGPRAATLLADAALANPYPASKVVLLGELESQWAEARAEVPRLEPLTRDADPDVRAAASAALARVAPAHRAEAAVRGDARSAARPAPAPPAPGARPVDWLAFGEAIKSGQAARLRAQVNRGNVNLTMTMMGNPTQVGPPINGVLSYCGFPQIPESHLVTALGILLELGADPTVLNEGSGGGSALDYAVLACPSAVQRALGIEP